MSTDPLVAGIEGGGTKWVCAVGTGPGDKLLARTSFPTGDNPSRLLESVVAWLKEQQAKHGELKAIGIASFGPVDLQHGLEREPRSPTYGHITSTPKLAWRNTDVVGVFERAFPGLPIGFDTDVNGAALGERTWVRPRDSKTSCTSRSAPAWAPAAWRVDGYCTASCIPRWGICVCRA